MIAAERRRLLLVYARDLRERGFALSANFELVELAREVIADPETPADVRAEVEALLRPVGAS